MENGIFISRLVRRFDVAAASFSQKYGIGIELARITGRRWSRVAGTPAKEIPVSAPGRRELGGGYGLIIYGWDRLLPEEQDGLLEAFSFVSAMAAHLENS